MKRKENGLFSHLPFLPSVPYLSACSVYLSLCGDIIPVSFIDIRPTLASEGNIKMCPHPVDLSSQRQKSLSCQIDVSAFTTASGRAYLRGIILTKY